MEVRARLVVEVVRGDRGGEGEGDDKEWGGGQGTCGGPHFLSDSPVNEDATGKFLTRGSSVV